MAKAKKPLFGKLEPRYDFVLNPYPDMRISKCPFCERKTGQRKLPLLIHVDPANLIALNYTCRYCQACDLLVAHKHTLEHLLAGLFSQTDSEVVGNDYLIIGTLEKATWREGLQHPQNIMDVRLHARDFVNYYKELRVTQPGWYKADQEPPVMEPPPSEEWVKARPG